MSQCPSASYFRCPFQLLVSVLSTAAVSLLLQSHAAAHNLDPRRNIETNFQNSFQNHEPDSKIFCEFNKKEYSPGDVWFPPVPARSSVTICIRCICLSTGNFNCTRVTCSRNCEENSEGCCKTCSGRVPNMNFSGDDGNDLISDLSSQQEGKGLKRVRKVSIEAEEGDETSSGEDTDEDEEDENGSCVHQGMTFRDGEAFTANVSGLPIANVDQCLQCQCQAGMVLCAMKPCFSFKCNLADRTTGDSCCQRCAAWKSMGNSNLRKSLNEIFQSRVVSNSVIKDASVAGNRQQTFETQPHHQSKIISPALDGSVTFRDIPSLRNGNGKQNQKPRNDCISAGIFYLHGSTWHPTVGPFGPMECVSCKCNFGQIDCGRLKCPLRRELPCAKPMKVEGHCCPICTSSPLDKTFEGMSFCVSAKQDITAFKSIGFGHNDTEYIEFAFLRPRRLTGGSSMQVERHEWRLIGTDIDEFTTHYLSLAQFDALRNRQAFILSGATNEKNVGKFTRREKKLEKRCTARCKVRISSLERSLRLHKLISRPQCLGFERVVHTV